MNAHRSWYDCKRNIRLQPRGYTLLSTCVGLPNGDTDCSRLYSVATWARCVQLPKKVAVSSLTSPRGHDALRGCLDHLKPYHLCALPNKCTWRPEPQHLYYTRNVRYALPGSRQRFEFINSTLLELGGLQSLPWSDGKCPFFQGFPGGLRGIFDGKGPAPRSSGLKTTNRLEERPFWFPKHVV